MILREIEFAFLKRSEVYEYDFRLRINHIIDSIYFRMPKKLKTSSVIKLVCFACEEPYEIAFQTAEGVGTTYVDCPNAEKILHMEQEKAVSAVIEVLKKGVDIAAKYDDGIRENIEIIKNLIDSSPTPFDYYRGIKRSHRSRKYKCEGIIHIQPNKYISEVLVSDKQGNLERIKIKEIEPIVHCTDLGFNKLLWEGDAIVGMTDNFTTFKLEPKIVRN